jgi:hypothetical protein
MLAAICWTTVELSKQDLLDMTSVRRARALNRKTDACRPCRWNDESANADCNTAAEDGELSDRARRNKRPKNSFLSGSKMARVDGAVQMTACVSLARFITNIIFTVINKFSVLIT